MENNSAMWPIQNYLLGEVFGWVDRDMLRMLFSPYQIDNAISLGWLKPIAPGEHIIGENAEEDVLVTESYQVYYVQKSALAKV